MRAEGKAGEAGRWRARELMDAEGRGGRRKRGSREADCADGRWLEEEAGGKDAVGRESEGRTRRTVGLEGAVDLADRLQAEMVAERATRPPSARPRRPLLPPQHQAPSTPSVGLRVAQNRRGPARTRSVRVRTGKKADTTRTTRRRGGPVCGPVKLRKLE